MAIYKKLLIYLKHKTRSLFWKTQKPNNEVRITELTPNEAEILAEKLRDAGFNVKYAYVQSLFFQSIAVEEVNEQTLTEVKKNSL